MNQSNSEGATLHSSDFVSQQKHDEFEKKVEATNIEIMKRREEEMGKFK